SLPSSTTNPASARRRNCFLQKRTHLFVESERLSWLRLFTNYPLFLLQLTAFGLNSSKVLEIALELTPDALLVHAEGRQRLGIAAVSLGARQRTMDFRIINNDTAGLFVKAECQQSGLDTTAA